MKISSLTNSSLKRLEKKAEENTFKGNSARAHYLSLFIEELAPLRKQENWKRYVAWCRRTRTGHSKEAVAAFKKTIGSRKMSPKERCMPPITPKYIGWKLAHVPTYELYPFYKKCLEARNFSEWFFGRLRVK